MVLFEEHYYELNRKMMCFVGIWPFQSSRDRIVRKCIVLSFIVTGMTAQVSALLTSEFNLNILVESLAIETICCGIYMKYAVYSVYYNEIKQLALDIKYSWHLIDSIEETKLIRESAEDGRKFVATTSLLMYLAITVTVGITSTWPYIMDVLSPINGTRPREFFVPLEYFVDTQKYFPILILHVDISIFCATAVLVSTESMFMTCVYHACGLFQISGYQLQHAYDGNSKIFSSDYGNRRLRQKIARGVAFHRRVIRYTQAIIDVYSWPYFLHTLFIVGNISLTLYYLTMHMNKMQIVILHSVFVTSQVSQFFTIIYPAQRLMDVSSAVFYKAYSAQWYKVSYVSQKLCLFAMQRSVTPCVISVGKMFIFTLKEYATLIQASLSYFMVLRSMKTL